MSDWNCAMRDKPHPRHQLAGPGGAKPGAWCEGLEEPVEFGAHDQGYVHAMTDESSLQGVGMPPHLIVEPVDYGPVCPDCVAGKCGICQGEALDEANDMIVSCQCPHESVC